MGGQRVTVRILGLVSTTKGFAFALTEGPERLVSCELLRVPNSRAELLNSLSDVLHRSRPLFVAFDKAGSEKKRARGQLFSAAVAESCDAHGIMLFDKLDTRGLSDVVKPSKWDVANAVAKRFPEIAHRLPKRRAIWQSEDDRVGLFLALAAAVSGWREFQPKKKS